MSRGNPIIEAWEARTLAEREAVIVTARCAFCDVFELEGTVADTRAAYTAHREKAHPEVQPKPRRPRRLHRLKTGNSDLDDNIANARAEGAAGWAGPL